MRSLLLALAFGSLAGEAYGQTDSFPTPGQRVWVRSRSAAGALSAGVKGTLEGIAGDTLRVQPRNGAPLLLVVAGPPTELFVFAGRRSSAGRGAAIGGGVGVLAGALLGFAGGEDCSGDEWLCFDRSSLAAAGAIGLGGIGLIGGLIVGAFSSHDTWKQVKRGVTVRPQVTPGPGGVRFGLSVSF